MKRLKIERSKFKWHNGVFLLFLIFVLLSSDKLFFGLLLHYVLSLILIAILLIDFLFGYHYVKYDSYGIIELKIGLRRKENIWFVDMKNIRVGTEKLSFEHHMSRLFRKPKIKSYSFNLIGFNPADVDTLNSLLLEKCQPAITMTQNSEEIV